MKATEELVGATVGRIYMSDKRLTFVTDKGIITLGVSKQKCPKTFFCDFYGANHLFGRKVISVTPIPVSEKNRKYRHTLPKPRSWQKKIGYSVFTDINEKTPALLGYEISTKDADGTLRRSVFSIHADPETPVPVTLVLLDTPNLSEDTRIIKPVFRMTPREHCSMYQ